MSLAIHDQGTASSVRRLLWPGCRGQHLGIKGVDDGIRLVSFMDYDLGAIDLEQKTLPPIDNPFGTRLLPMCPVWTQRGMVPGEGFEPPTFGLQHRCTTAVLTRPDIVIASS